MRPVNLGPVAVGGDNPPYVIAEVGSNHNGDMDLCLKLIDAAAEAGADAVKFQSWTESSLIAREEYERNPSYTDKKKHFGSLREMVRAYQLTPEQHVIASDHARERGIAFCSSAFAPAEADMLAGLDVPFIKIASMDITNLLAPGTCRPDGQARRDLDGDGHAGRDRAGHGYRACPGQRGRHPAPLRRPSIRRRRRPSTCATWRPCAAPSTFPSGSATTPWGRRSRSPPSPWAHA